MVLSVGAAVSEQIDKVFRELDHGVSLAEFGVVGDGVSNDNAAITAAINATLTQQKSMLWLPPLRYLVDDLIIPEGLRLFGPGATMLGRVFMEEDTELVLRQHLATKNNTAVVNKQGGGRAVYRAETLDTRGKDGDLTPVIGFSNGSSGGVLLAFVSVLFVGEASAGITDTASGFGHSHFLFNDLYLAGQGAVGISTLFASTNLVGYVDHILKLNDEDTGTVGVKLTTADSECKLTCGEIIADEVWNISAGDLYIQCPKLTGSRTGTPVFLSGPAP